MRGAAVVLCAMGTLWGAAAMLFAGLPTWTIVAPALIAAAFVAIVWRGTRPESRSAAERRRMRLVLLAAIAFEAFAAWAGLAIVFRAGRPDLAPAMIAGVVGLHFLPLARWLPASAYYATALALVLLAVAGAAIGGRTSEVIVCAGAALILWVTPAARVVQRARVRPAG